MIYDKLDFILYIIIYIRIIIHAYMKEKKSKLYRKNRESLFIYLFFYYWNITEGVGKKFIMILPILQC